MKTGSNTGNCGVANNTTQDTIDPYRATGTGEGSDTATSAQYSNGAVNVVVSAADGSIPAGNVQVTVSKPALPGQPAPAASYSYAASLTSDGTNGVASVKIPARVSGSSVIDVAYLPASFGAANNAGGHAALGTSYKHLTATISSQPSSISGSVPTVKYGQAHAVTASVAGTFNGAHATGSVRYVVAGKTFSGTLNSNGVATIVLPKTIAPGTFSGTLSYAGDANFGAGQAALKLVVTKAGTTVATTQFASALTGKVYNVNVVIKHLIGAAVPAGTVNLFKGTIKIGTATLSSGKATIHVTAANMKKYLVKGRRTALVVRYPGNAFYGPSSKTIYVTRK